ncbi:MAG: hypothetical protein NTX71_06260 [Candidatus Aureabacteria bacterium]|nr:hypothetical protein [Candidatus Auribacterota bacterium]
MKAVAMLCAAIVLLGPVADRAFGAEKADEGAIREAFNTNAALYIQTTQADLQSNINFPNVGVTLLSSGIEKTDSLVTPYKGKAEYVIEYDNPAEKGLRKTHPYIMRCTYFNGKWDIDPHGHARKKNIEDLEPPLSKTRVSPDV